MAAIIQDGGYFEAKWTPQNLHLKPPCETRVSKIKAIFWNVISILIIPIGIARTIGWAIHFMVKKLILPSAWFYPKQILLTCKDIFIQNCKILEKDYFISKQKIQTPDGVILRGLHFKSKLADENCPTVILYQSNASISFLNIYTWLLSEAIKRKSPCNFVIFDYRGVGKSQGDANYVKDLILDADSAYQYVKDHLKVSPNKIHMYGWSLGGGIGASVKALHPECTGKFVNERSFSSLKEVASYIIPRALWPLFFWFPWAAEQEGWNLQAPLKKIQGETMILYHKKDSVIPYFASAHRAATSAKLNIKTIELIDSKKLQRKRQKSIDHHSEQLTSYVSGRQIPVTESIADFILERPSIQTNL